MNVFKIIKVVFLLIGVAMLVGTTLLVQNTRQFLQSARHAEGEVIQLVESRSSNSSSYTYAPRVTFVDDAGENHVFTSGTSSNPPSYDVGERVDVLYEAGKASSAKLNGTFSLWGGAIILGIMGGVFTLIGASMVVVPKLISARKSAIRQTGTPVETQFQSIEINDMVEVNGRNPFRIVTQWQHPITHEIHVFESDNIWFDPNDYIPDAPITVYVDMSNPKRYTMDIGFLPRLAK